MAKKRETQTAATECADHTQSGSNSDSWRLTKDFGIATEDLKYLSFFIADATVCFYVLLSIPYTEIDWKAYMQEVKGFIGGETNYYALQGDTGPLVYPAGFVYIFSILHYITENGKNIMLAQWIFFGLYLAQLGIMMDLYRQSKEKHFAMIALLSASRRLHSIFLLRCFNDGFAMTIAFLSFSFATRRRWSWTCFFFSLAVSVKMNVLLFAPGLLFLLWTESGGSIIRTARYLSICALVQVVLGAPFLLSHPLAYLHRAFEFGRVFTFKWSVNWAFLPEEVFVSKRWALLLLSCHFLALTCFFKFRWLRIFPLRTAGQSAAVSPTGDVKAPQTTAVYEDIPTAADSILFVLFTCNFIGIVFARSLHYQFLAWYYPTLPWLVFQINVNVFTKILILSFIEYVWNVYPPQPEMSIMLLTLHMFILLMLFFQLTDRWRRCMQKETFSRPTSPLGGGVMGKLLSIRF